MTGEPGAASKAAALERAMKERQQQDPTTWERIKRLFSTSGTDWADNANAMLPQDVSGRKAVLTRRKRDAALDELNRSE